MLTTFTLPAEADKGPLSKKLWQQSRRLKDGKILPAGRARDFNLTNLRIAFDAVCLLTPRALAAARAPENSEGMKLLSQFIALLFIEAFFPTFSMYAYTQLMNKAEDGLAGRAVSISAVLWTAGLYLLTKLFAKYTQARVTQVNRELTEWYCYRLARAYLCLKLGEPLAEFEDDDERHIERMALFHEAGIHAGEERGCDAEGRMVYELSDTRNRLRNVLFMFRNSICLVSEISFAWVTLGRPGYHNLASCIILVPLLFKIVQGMRLRAKVFQVINRRLNWSPRHRELDKFRTILEKGFDTQQEEIHMLDIGDFLLRRWDVACTELLEIKKARPQAGDTYAGTLDTVAFTIMWVGISTRVIRVDASLSTILVTTTFFDQLHYRLAEIIAEFRNVLNNIFFVLPFFAVEDERQQVTGLIDYEATRRKRKRSTENETSDAHVSTEEDVAAPAEKSPAAFPEDGVFIAEDVNDEKPVPEGDPVANTPIDSIAGHDLTRTDSGLGSRSELSTVGTDQTGMAISLRDVSVKYSNGSVAVKNVSLEVAAGETLAIVGHNGSGKTTLIRALLGLMKASGSIELNGVSRAELDPVTVARRVATVFQETTKHGLTLGEEIGIGCLSDWEKGEGGVAKSTQLPVAVERSDAQPILSRIPLDQTLSTASREWAAARLKLDAAEGIALGLAERDAREATYLSGGEWQRVALARAFMRKDADLLVFDEPTSNLDPRAEAKLFDTLLSLRRQGCTTIFISHGFCNVKRADRIAFMEKGEIKEYGTHEELIKLGGQYNEFYSLQADRFK